MHASMYLHMKPHMKPHSCSGHSTVSFSCLDFSSQVVGLGADQEVQKDTKIKYTESIYKYFPFLASLSTFNNRYRRRTPAANRGGGQGPAGLGAGRCRAGRQRMLRQRAQEEKGEQQVPECEQVHRKLREFQQMSNWLMNQRMHNSFMSYA